MMASVYALRSAGAMVAKSTLVSIVSGVQPQSPHLFAAVGAAVTLAARRPKVAKESIEATILNCGKRTYANRNVARVK